MAAMSEDAGAEGGMRTQQQFPICLDFSVKSVALPRYRWRKIRPEGNQTPGAAGNGLLAANAQNPVQIRFGSGYTINLAMSRLTYSETFAAPQSAAAAGFSYNIINLVPGIDAVKLSTSTGTVLVDIPNFQAMFHLVRDWTITHDDLLSRSTEAPLRPTADGVEIYPAQSYANCKLGARSYTAPAQSLAWQPYIVSIPANGIGFADAGGTAAAPALKIANTVPLALVLAKDGPVMPATLGMSSSKTATTIHWDMYMRDLLPHSLFAVSQDLYFGADLLLNITFSSGNSRAVQVDVGAQEETAANSAFATSRPSIVHATPATANLINGAAGFFSAPAQPRSGPSFAAGVPSNAAALQVEQKEIAAQGDLKLVPAVPASGKTYSTFLPAGDCSTNQGVSIVPASFYFQLAAQDNEELVNQIIDSVTQGGIKIPVQWWSMTEDNCGWTGDVIAQAQAPQVYIKQAYKNLAAGASILRIYSAVAAKNPYGATDLANQNNNSGDSTLTATGATSLPYAFYDNPTASICETSAKRGQVVALYSITYNNSQQADFELNRFEVFSRMRPLIERNKYPLNTYERWMHRGGVMVEDLLDSHPLHGEAQTTPIGGLSLANPVDILTKVTSGTALPPSVVAGGLIARSSVPLYFLQGMVQLRFVEMSGQGISIMSQ